MWRKIKNWFLEWGPVTAFLVAFGGIAIGGVVFVIVEQFGPGSRVREGYVVEHDWRDEYYDNHQHCSGSANDGTYICTWHTHYYPAEYWIRIEGQDPKSGDIHVSNRIHLHKSEWVDIEIGDWYVIGRGVVNGER